VLNLAEYASIRVLAERIGLESLDREGQLVVLKFRPDAKLDPAWLFRVVQERGDIVLIPPGTIKLDLKTAEARPNPSRSPAGRARAVTRWPAARGGPPGRRPVRSPPDSPGPRS
jgi:hypothetical protein